MNEKTTNSKITTTLSIITSNSSHSFNVSYKTTYNSVPSTSVVKDISPNSDNVSNIHLSTPTSIITNHVTSTTTIPDNDKTIIKPTISLVLTENCSENCTNNSSSKTNNVSVNTIDVATTNTPLTVQNSVYLPKTIPSQTKPATPVSSSSFMTVQTYKGDANNRILNIQHSLVAFIMVLLV